MIWSYTNRKRGMFCSQVCQMNLEISQANTKNTKEQSVFSQSFTKSGHDVIFSKAQAWLVALLADAEQCLTELCHINKTKK